jgi:hypothetical protein
MLLILNIILTKINKIGLLCSVLESVPLRKREKGVFNVLPLFHPI